MLRIVAILTFLIFGGCTHENITGKSNGNGMSQLGVVIIDYHNEHIKLTINGESVFDEVVHSQRGGSGISASTVTMATSDLSIDFCVDGECLQKDMNRSKGEVYLSIYRKGPIALNPPMIELSAELEGLD